MSNTANIMISVHAKYVEKFLEGTKRIEVRRRRMNIQPGTRVWIYTTAPEARVGVSAVIESICISAPRILWKMHHLELGVTRSEFDAYFSGSNYACGLVLRDILRLEQALRLAEFRNRCRAFQPPQFFKRLYEGSPELDLLRASSRASTKEVTSREASAL